MRSDKLARAREGFADACAQWEAAMADVVAGYGALWRRGSSWWPAAVLAVLPLAVVIVLMSALLALFRVLGVGLYLGGWVAVAAAPTIAIGAAVVALAGDGDRPARAETRQGICEPSYPDLCVPAGIGDIDCRGAGGNGPYADGFNFKVRGSDPYNLDRDDDGIACEWRPVRTPDVAR